ncbi:hypothetical protein DBT_0491 [Dissulfuribacter thermophilus]|uniref:Uncharacterized protein n=1 Tax=Dissulfuribacter thermophilus TaxID=1156395 RepID=A0A1B9F7W9_9BACT|nr:hypothetical protein DBT_0491 [Dissulfuribacter thermophilus]
MGESIFCVFCPLLPPLGIADFAKSAVLWAIEVLKDIRRPSTSIFGKLGNCRI